MEHSMYLQNRSLYVIVSILLVLAIMISMTTPAHAVAMEAALVTVGGAVIIASIFTAFGLISTANNSETVKGLVNQCLADGITAGIFDADGNLLTRTIGSVTMVLTSVINWVKSWFSNNSTIQNGGSITYRTAREIYTANETISLSLSEVDRVNFYLYAGVSPEYIVMLKSDWGLPYCYSRSGTVYLFQSYFSSTARPFSIGNGTTFQMSQAGWQGKVSNGSHWNSTGSGNTDLAYFGEGAILACNSVTVSIELGSHHAGSLPLSTTFPTWTEQEINIPTTLDNDGVTAPALPMTIPETVDDALSMSQTEAQGATDLGYESPVDPGDGEGPIVPWYSNIFGGIWQYAESVIDYCIEAAQAFIVCLSAFLPTRVQDYIWLCAAIVIIFGTFKLFIR